MTAAGTPLAEPPLSELELDVEPPAGALPVPDEEVED
jgi:hypothetical protein